LQILLSSEKQKRDEILHSGEIARFFLPSLTKIYYLNFYGGEPLLSFDLIKKAVSLLSAPNKEFKKKARYSLTTNGSLLREETIQFLHKHKFSVELSFDGLAQDILRKKGSSKKIVSVIQELLNFPNIHLEINSVYTPTTVDLFSDSMRFIMALGVPNIHFSLSIIDPWDEISLGKLEKELIKLGKIVLTRYKKNGDISITNFRDFGKKGIFYCAAGSNRLAITPSGNIWGCYLFADYFKGKENLPEYQKFSFGHLHNFIQNHKKGYSRISSNYKWLSMDNFSTPKMKCFLCRELEKCAVCPINASLSGSSLGSIPSYVCEIQRIKMREKERLWEEMQKIN
jgi:sulfatase maturation enzyme AslB (radical SAM superfamily)